MSAQAYGGVKGNASGGRFSAGLSASAGGGYGAPAGGAVGVPGPPAGSPYTATPPTVTAGLPTHRMLLVLVGLEVLALIALRGGFRHYHGG